MPDLVIIASRRVVTPDGEQDGAILIRDGRIDAVVPRARIPAGAPVEDFGRLAILPGLVDPHVHVNEPGRTEWEGFDTATRAAAAGGITTLVDMPLNSTPVTTDVAALRQKLAATTGKLSVDVAFHGGLIPGNAGDLESLIDAGVVGIKAFLVHSGIDDFPNATEPDLHAAMPILARRNVPLLVHAELDGDAPKAGRTYASYLASRPRHWENRAVRLLIRLCREFRCPVHIVHLSSSDVLDELSAAKSEGLPLTVETCPHYLFFDAERIAEGDTRFKCAPPIREAENRERLWEGLRSGVIDLIASDHSPCPPEMKRLESGDFATAWGGIASLQLGLCAVWTQASARGLGLVDLARWMAQSPARMVRLDSSRGAIAPGRDANLVVFDPEARWNVSGPSLLHRHKLTPYEGVELAGRVRATYLRGRKIYEDGRMIGSASGQPLLAPR
ncbi:MAG TPA: allantoinase AllB [Tepidisphaeraceae bacterium]|jgi:allantoinase